MADHLFGFNPGSFEQFVQALSHLVLGPGVAIFGKGPDGGREATFEGEVPYPFQTDRWRGYGIIQAKYKDKTEGTSTDQDWALKELKKELEAFSISEKRIKKPEYYIFVTNVVLTPVANTGGKDKAKKLLEDYGSTLGIKGHAIWDHDQLLTFINTHSELRKRFRYYLTGNDLISEALQWIERQRSEFEDAILSFIEREFRWDSNAKLDQAGRRTDEQTPLARVFIDIPATTTPEHEPPHEFSGDLATGLLRDLIDLSGAVLDPQAIADRSYAAEIGAKVTNKLVVIGGPGSGKSTMGQFLAQLHRAALLDRRPVVSLVESTRRSIVQLRDYCALDKIPWPASPRYPFRVELSSFATALASGRVRSLAEFLVKQVARERNVVVEDLFRWLTGIPCVLILDGLDEVPPTSNRDAACLAIQDFIAELTRHNADLLVVATTRPQGYKGEFGQDAYQHFYLQSLSDVRAQEYVRRFVVTKYGSDSPEAERVINILADAPQNDLTAKLMRTPLQVTFLVILVAAGGSPPRDRWNLFNEYFYTIYKREKQKSDDDLRRILDLPDLVHRVHHEVGYILQVQSEAASGTHALMAISQFDSLIDEHLTNGGWLPKDAAPIKEQISRAAKERLVFLVSRIAGQLGFDVRSLQEYMAAEMLTSGPDQIVKSRMTRIATSSHWRNVFLFAAGKFFVQPGLQHLRHIVHEVCELLGDEEHDRVAFAARMGARLALDLMSDGAVMGTPNSARRFARLALQLLDTARSDPEDLFYPAEDFAGDIPVRLAKVYESPLETVYKEALETRLSHQTVNRGHAWRLVAALIARGVEWSTELANRFLPTNPDDTIGVLLPATPGNGSRWLVDNLSGALLRIEPKSLRAATYCIRGITRNKDVGLQSPEWLEELAAQLNATEDECRLTANSLSFRVALSWRSIASGSLPCFHEMATRLNVPLPAWEPIICGSRFAASPSAAVLSEELYRLSRCDFSRDRFISWMLPWPLRGCLLHVKNKSMLVELAELAKRGDLGDHDDWLAAERRWTSVGVDIEEIVGLHDSLPFTKEIAIKGPPPSAQIGHIERVFGFAEADTMPALMDWFSRASSSGGKNLVAQLLMYQLIWAPHDEVERPRFPLPSVELLHTIIAHMSRNIADVLFAFDWPEKLDRQWIDFLEQYGSGVDTLSFFRHTNGSFLIEKMAALFILEPDHGGILNLLGELLVSGFKIALPQRLLDPQRFENVNSKRAAILLGLAQQQWTPKLAQEHASKVNAMEQEYGQVVSRALDWVSTQIDDLESATLDTGSAESFLLTLLRFIGPRDSDAKLKAEHLLLTLSLGRMSGFADCAVARQLSLPWLPVAEP